MGVYSLTKSSIKNWVKYPNMMAGSEPFGDFELINTTVLSSSAASVTFSGLAAVAASYRHLQIRHVSRSDTTGSQTVAWLTFNGDNNANYSVHRLTGSGTSVVSNGNASQYWCYAGIIPAASGATGNFAATAIDLLDPFSTTKNKTIKLFTGNTSGNEFDLYSSAWYSMASVSSILISPYAGNFIAGSRFSLYGLKA